MKYTGLYADCPHCRKITQIDFALALTSPIAECEFCEQDFDHRKTRTWLKQEDGEFLEVHPHGFYDEVTDEDAR